MNEAEAEIIAMLKVLLKSLSGQVPPTLSQMDDFQKLLTTLGELSNQKLDHLYQSLSFKKEEMSQLMQTVAKDYRIFFGQTRTNAVSKALGDYGRFYELAVFIFWVNTVAQGKAFSDFLKKERAKACEVCYAYATLGISADAFLNAYFSEDFQHPQTLPVIELQALWANYWKECSEHTKPDRARSEWLLDRALHQETDLA